MMRSLVIAVAAALVALAAYLHFRPSDGTSKVELSYVYSTNQAELLEPLIDRFNDENHGIEVVGEGVSSGEAADSIAARTRRPVLWSPASGIWGRLLDHEADASWAAAPAPALVRTPLVIAMWEAEARALGWPRKPITFERILQLAKNRRGWADYGLPTYGPFKLGHTNPDFSTSGLSFVAAQYYVATGKRSGLTVDDVNRPAVHAWVRGLEQSIVHYGDTGSFFTQEMKKRGPGYVSAVAMEEVSLLEYNAGRGASPALVAVYPAEGTFVFDNPLIRLRAPWVTPAEAAAARTFTRWLRAHVTATLAARYGYRPGDPSVKPAAPITTSKYVDPAQPRVTLELPDRNVLAAIKRAWHEDRKAANVAIVVDVSGSMAEHDRLANAQKGLRVFLQQFSPRDRVGLFTFADDVSQVVPIAPMAQNRGRLRAAVDTLVAGGGTAVYDATDSGVLAVGELRDTTRINAVVVLTDGDDTASDQSAGSLIQALRGRAENTERNIRVFTIAYGGEADAQTLSTIAEASGGKGFAGDPSEIAAVYRQISSYF